MAIGKDKESLQLAVSKRVGREIQRKAIILRVKKARLAALLLEAALDNPVPIAESLGKLMTVDIELAFPEARSGENRRRVR